MDDAPSPAEAECKLRLLPRTVLSVRLGLDTLCDDLAPLSATARLARIAAERPGAVLAYLAHALPEREAVWWSCMCVLATAPADMPAAETRALSIAQEWVRRPAARSGQEVLAAVREAGGSTPAAFAARAALTARLDRRRSLRAAPSVRQAVLGAASSTSAPASVVLDRFRASAVDIAGGGAGWIAGERDSP